jgi:glycosyltransferase involved in cell wall biosynthesis
VVHHGVSDVFRPGPADEATAVFKRLGIDQPYFLAIGAVSPRKNFARLLAAWSQLRGLSGTHSLVVVGRTDLLFSGNGRIGTTSVSIKHVVSVSDPDLAALYSGAVAFVYPSIYEGFGLPLLEAMACGAPVIASNTAAIPEVVGNAAMLVDPYDVDSIAATMRCVALDPALRDELRNRGSIRSQLFSWDRAAEQTWSLLAATAA